MIGKFAIYFPCSASVFTTTDTVIGYRRYFVLNTRSIWRRFSLSRASKRTVFMYCIVPCMTICIAGATYAIKYFTKDEVLSSNLGIALRNSVFPILLAVVSFLFIIVWSYIKEKGYRLRRLFVVLLVFITLTDLFRFGWKFTPFVSGKYFFPHTGNYLIFRKRTSAIPRGSTG